MPTLQEWVEGYRQSWVNRDPGAAAALFTTDATYRANIFEEPFRGPEGVADYWRTVTASQWSPSTQPASQNAGHTRPVISGRLLVACSAS